MPTLSKRPVTYLAIFICLVTTSATAQTTKVAEFLRQLDKVNSDTARIRVMKNLSGAYSTVDPIKKLQFANQYRLLAEKNQIDSTAADGYQDMGIAYALRSNLDSALYYFNLAQGKAKKCNYLPGVARSLVNIGYTFDRLDRKKEAAKSYEQSLTIFRKLRHKKGINQCITNLGSLYFDLKEYKTADQYFRQVLENLKETPNDKLSLGKAFYTLGCSNSKLGNAKKAMEYYKKSLSITTQIGDLSGIALNNWGIGQLHVEKKDFNTALIYLNIALHNNRTSKNLYQECAVLITVAEAYLGLGERLKAEKNANSALFIAKELNSRVAISLALEVFSKVKAAQKKFDEALSFKSAYIAVNDSLKNEETKRAVIINDLHRINVDNQNLEKDNKTIASKNTEYLKTISIITALLFLIAILFALYYKRNQEKKAINILLQKEKKAVADANEELATLNEELKSQMDIISAQNISLEKLNVVKNKFFSIVSHDLRGPLATLKMLFGLYREGDLAEKEMNGLLATLEQNIHITADFLDNLLEWAKSQLDGMVINPSVIDIHQIVKDNIVLMSSQINLKQLVVQNNIELSATAFADANMINVVFRNLLSNAIKFCNIGDTIIFKANKVEKGMVFTITDSGPGISEQDMESLFTLSHNTSTGTSGEKGNQIGLILCKDMITQNNGKLEVQSKLGEGTTFVITLPLKN